MLFVDGPLTVAPGDLVYLYEYKAGGQSVKGFQRYPLRNAKGEAVTEGLVKTSKGVKHYARGSARVVRVVEGRVLVSPIHSS